MLVKAKLRFWTGGRLIEPGEEVEVDDALAREIMASGKAEPADPPPPPSGDQDQTNNTQGQD